MTASKIVFLMVVVLAGIAVWSIGESMMYGHW